MVLYTSSTQGGADVYPTCSTSPNSDHCGVYFRHRQKPEGPEGSLLGRAGFRRPRLPGDVGHNCRERERLGGWQRRNPRVPPFVIKKYFVKDQR